MADPKEGYNSGITRVVSSGAIDSDGNYVAGGAVHTRMVASDVVPPESAYLSWIGVAGAGDDDVLYTSSDISEYNTHSIENESGVAIDVFVSIDGVNYSTAAKSVVLADQVTTGKAYSITVPDNKIGVITGKFKSIRVDQAAAGSITAGTVRGAHSNG